MTNTRGALFPYPEAVRRHVIEPGIQPLVDALFRAGAEPLASCQGHGFWSGVAYDTPYVFFTAPQPLVARLLRLIRADVAPRRTRGELSWRWAISAILDSPEAGLNFAQQVLQLAISTKPDWPSASTSKAPEAQPDDDGCVKWTLRAYPRRYRWPTRRALTRDVLWLARSLG